MVKFSRRKSKYQLLLLTLGVLTSICITAFGFLSFWEKLSEHQYKETTERLHEISKHSILTIETKLGSLRDIMLSIASSVEKMDLNLDVEQLETIENRIEAADFTSFVLTDANGIPQFISGTFFTEDDTDFFQKYVGEGFKISTTVTTESGEILLLKTPLHKNNSDISGMAYATYPVKNLEVTLGDSLNDLETYVQLVDKNGNYASLSTIHPLTLAHGGNFWEEIEAYDFDEHYLSKEKLREAINQDQEGILQFLFNGNARFSYFTPLDIGDWYIFVTIPVDAIESSYLSVESLVYQLSGYILIAILITIFSIWMYALYSKRELMRAAENLYVSEETFRIAFSKTKSLIYLYDIHTKTLTFENTMGVSSMVNEVKNAPYGIVDLGIIHPDSVQDCIEMFEKIDRKEESAKCVILLNLGGSGYKWERISMTNIFTDDGEVARTIGIIEDITELKEKEAQEALLKTETEKDSLTGLFNRKYMEENVRKYLDNWEELQHLQAFIMIDLDNFKAINDNFGHDYGDFVLKDVAEKVIPLFRSTDIISRFGGDEFVIFMKEVTTTEVMKNLAQKMVDRLKQTYEKDGQTITVSASAGIAICPTHGVTFDELYKKADTALYQVKHHGKSGISVYGEESGKAGLDLYQLTVIGPNRQ